MNSLIDNIEDEEEHSGRGADREITLGTTMILLIFFALAVYGAVLFGFGYSMGSKHSAGATVAGEPGSSLTFNGMKPSPGNPVGAGADKIPPNLTSSPVPYTAPAAVKSVPVADAAQSAAAPDPNDIVSNPPATKPTATAVVAASPNATPAAPVAAVAGPVPAGTVVVQIAAVSHQEDADLIATTLRRRGYTVNIRTEPDKLLHVQVGPFTNRKDAEAMKAKLLADGFNAYIK